MAAEAETAPISSADNFPSRGTSGKTPTRCSYSDTYNNKFNTGSPCTGELRSRAAGGRESGIGITAAIEKREEKRKPEAFFANRKAASGGAKRRMRGVRPSGHFFIA